MMQPARAVPDGAVEIREFSDADLERWNRFVESRADGTFFHLAEWRQVIEGAFGHRTHYLYAERDGEIAAVLPLVHVRSRLFGNALSSTPFCVYGGILASDRQAGVALEREAVRRAEDLGVDHLEMRNREAQQDWPTKDLYVTFRRPIDPDPDANLKAIPRKQRAMVRKGMKAGLASEIDQDVARFFRAYSTSVRNLGTPVFPRRYFRLLKEVFGDRCEVLVVVKDIEPVCAVMSFYFRDEVLPYYGGGGDRARDLKGNDFMYWEVMRRAAERGFRTFDYGRSKRETGSYHFKKNWGFEPQPLHYQYRLVRATRIPEVNPMNPKYRLFINAWKRLPLPVANSLGPLISGSLG